MKLAPMLSRIEAPYFVAGIEVDEGHVCRAAPIIRYMVGWTSGRMAAYCQAKGWHVERVA